ncbi:MAG: nucleoside phosphorylase [Bacteroidales bacterium]|nr:nucleoside phosphorylase [Candidatus Colimorpha onthohippi]
MRIASELTLAPDGSLYHIHLKGTDIADDVILMGDPNRIDIVKNKILDTVAFETSNRELRSVTGSYHGHRFTALSTGMGCDNIDIVMTELDAAVNIDLATGAERSSHRSLRLVRMGSCGSLNAAVDAGSLVASKYAIGLDGLIHYYQHRPDQLEPQLTEAFVHHMQLQGGMAQPYAAAADSGLLHKVAFDMHQGITATAGGFYGPQGRNIRIAPAVSDINERLMSFEWNGNTIVNFEMETSAIYAMSRLMGHQALTVCLAIANRVTGRFMNEYHDKMTDALALVMDRLAQ